MDEASPFPSDHCPVIWDARGVFDPEAQPLVALWARHFQVRDQGIMGAHHVALAAGRRGQGERPVNLEPLYPSFLASTLQAVEEAPPPPPKEFGELPGRVD